MSSHSAASAASRPGREPGANVLAFKWCYRHKTTPCRLRIHARRFNVQSAICNLQSAMVRVSLVLLASSLACASAGAQQIIFTEPQSGVFFGDIPSPLPGGQPPRDGRPAANGTGQIRGRVLAADSGQPVRKAMVRLSSTELRVSRTSSTDPDGRYDFRDLPA